MGFLVGAKLAGDGIKHAITKADQLAGRGAHLRHHQFKCIQDAADPGGRERGADFLEQGGNFPAKYPVRQYLPCTVLVAAQVFPHRRHRQQVLVVFGQQCGFLTGAHGFQVGIAEGVERARVLRWVKRLQLCQGREFALLLIEIVPVTDHRR
ncbi:hypothetical protein D3C80_1538450 [compost metagenome]